MSTDSISPGASSEPGKTVQDYIDETPMWADATAVSYSPLTDIEANTGFICVGADTVSPKPVRIRPVKWALPLDTH